MSNIHGLNNFSNRENERGFSMMGGSNEPSGDPRNESFGKFLRDFCCPTFAFKSVIFFVSIADLVIYIVTLAYGVKINPNELLAPKTETLDAFGMKNPIKMQQGQLWRFITYAFLHANLVHLVVNLFSQIIIGSYIESMIGSFKTSVLYILAAIGGAIFSCLVSNNNGVGASVSIYGLLGAYIAFTVMNWNYLDRVQGSAKYMNLMFILFIVMLNITMGFTNPIIDNYGHIGGLIYGFFLIFVIHTPYETSDGMCCNYRVWFWISVITLSFLYIGGLILFYAVKIIQ